MKKFKYKYMSYKLFLYRKRILMVFFIVFIVLLASVPAILLLNMFFSQKGKSATFMLSYSDLDSDFSNVNYSGIENNVFLKYCQEYYLDGHLFVTDSSGIVEVNINDFGFHNFSMMFGGALHQYIFNESISENIILASKNITTTVMWNEIFVPEEGESVELWYYDGTSWILIETTISDVNGTVLYNRLAMGSYITCLTGTFEADVGVFELEQDIITYVSENILIDAVLTIIDVDYITSITGDTAVDLSTISWNIRCIENSKIFTYNINADGWIVNNETGVITIYNIQNVVSWEFNTIDYNGVLTSYAITNDGITSIGLVGKSVEAKYLWRYDNSPVVEVEFELFYLSGTEWISLGLYKTNLEGKVIITESLPIGQYMFEGQGSFVVIESDVVKIMTYVIESMFWEKPLLDFVGTQNPTIFYFFKLFKLKIMLTMVFLELWQIGFCLLEHSLNLLLCISHSSISLLKGGFLK